MGVTQQDIADKVAELIAMYEDWATRCGVLPWSEVIRKA